MSTRVEQLDHLRQEVNLNLAFGAVDDLDLVTNDRGECPVVVALDTEALSVVLGRLRAVGGYGTVFSRGPAGVRVVSMIHDVCAIGAPSDSLIPGPESEYGMYLDYVTSQPDGVAIPAAFDRPAKARDARPVELAEV